MLPFRDLYPEEGWIQELELDLRSRNLHENSGYMGVAQVDCLAWLLYFKFYMYY